MDGGDPWGQPTWRDHVERRLGGLEENGKAHGRELAHVRGDVKAIQESFDSFRLSLSNSITQQLGAVRADVIAEMRAPAQPASAPGHFDWKVVTVAAAILAGAIFGMGYTSGRNANPPPAVERVAP